MNRGEMNAADPTLITPLVSPLQRLIRNASKSPRRGSLSEPQNGILHISQNSSKDMEMACSYKRKATQCPVRLVM